MEANMLMNRCTLRSLWSRCTRRKRLSAYARQ